MSIAERTREAVREHPFLYEAVRAGVVNYTAAARFLDVGDEDAVTAALRRYGEELAAEEIETAGAEHSVRVRMESGLGRADNEGMLVVGETSFAPDAGNLTGILATGDLELGAVQRVLARCEIADVDVVAAGFTESMLVVVVDRRDGPDALRLVEAVTDAG